MTLRAEDPAERTADPIDGLPMITAAALQTGRPVWAFGALWLSATYTGVEKEARRSALRMGADAAGAARYDTRAQIALGRWGDGPGPQTLPLAAAAVCARMTADGIDAFVATLPLESGHWWVLEVLAGEVLPRGDMLLPDEAAVRAHLRTRAQAGFRRTYAPDRIRSDAEAAPTGGDGGWLPPSVIEEILSGKPGQKHMLRRVTRPGEALRNLPSRRLLPAAAALAVGGLGIAVALTMLPSSGKRNAARDVPVQVPDPPPPVSLPPPAPRAEIPAEPPDPLSMWTLCRSELASLPLYLAAGPLSSGTCTIAETDGDVRLRVSGTYGEARMGSAEDRTAVARLRGFDGITGDEVHRSVAVRPAPLRDRPAGTLHETPHRSSSDRDDLTDLWKPLGPGRWAHASIGTGIDGPPPPPFPTGRAIRLDALKLSVQAAGNTWTTEITDVAEPKP